MEVRDSRDIKIFFHVTSYSFLDEAQGAEALLILQSILDIRENQTSSTPSVMSKVYFTLAMLYFVLQDYNAVGIVSLIVVSLTYFQTLIGCNYSQQQLFLRFQKI